MIVLVNSPEQLAGENVMIKMENPIIEEIDEEKSFLDKDVLEKLSGSDPIIDELITDDEKLIERQIQDHSLYKPIYENYKNKSFLECGLCGCCIITDKLLEVCPAKGCTGKPYWVNWRFKFQTDMEKWQKEQDDIVNGKCI